MLKFEFTTSVNNQQTQNYESKISDYVESYLKKQKAKLGKIAEVVFLQNRKNVEQGIGIDDGQLAPLAPITIKNKGNARVLWDTGELFNSIKMQKTNEDEYNIFVSGNRSEIGIKLIKGKNNMPSREWFGINASVFEKIDNILKEEVK